MGQAIAHGLLDPHKNENFGKTSSYEQDHKRNIFLPPEINFSKTISSMKLVLHYLFTGWQRTYAQVLVYTHAQGM